jgi:LCP family protein required for cell wall assembly
VHARRSRPDRRPRADGYRIGAASLSAVLPGLGQLANRRTKLAATFAIPAVLLVGLVWLAFQLASPAQLAATVINPTVLSIMLVLNGLVLAWRAAAVAQAFFDRPASARPSGRAVLGLGVLLVVVAAPHLWALQVGLAARDSFSRIFAGDSGEVGGDVGAPRPASGERLNILLIGIDKTPRRNATLTDTLIVVSIDRVGRTVSMVSIPRDLVGVPLGNGDTYGPKLNSLMTYADAHPKEFPGGGVHALEAAVGALLDVPIHYHATIDFRGFVRIVDRLGGVDVNVAKGFEDPTYGYGGRRGFAITPGRHHLDGLDALAYVRARKAPGESDFTRAARQQEVILALRDQATRDGSLLWRLPGLFDDLGDTVRSDLPVEELPGLAVLADEIDRAAVVRVVVRFPLVKGGRNRYGSVQFPDIAAIRAMAAGVFTAPGTPPSPWPSPRPTPAP